MSVGKPLRVGLTYDLASEHLAHGASEEDVAEFDRDETIEALCAALGRMGHLPERIGGIRSLTQHLAAGARWDLVFNIAEGQRGAARESQVPALLDAFGVPYTFSDPLVLAVALHKGYAKAIVQTHGVPTAAYHVVGRCDELAGCRLEFPLFAKPVAEGTSKGITADSIITGPERLESICSNLLERYAQPVLLEEYLPGREFTVGILGTGQAARPLGTLEVHLVGDADVGVYSYRNKKQFEGKVEYDRVRPDLDPVVSATEAVAVHAWRALGCRDAGRVDVRLDATGRPCFIEVNPLAGLNPEISDLAILVRKTGFGYQALIEGIVHSACSRAGIRA